MPKQHVLKIRFDARDRERLQELVDHYSSPAATVVRLLIKEKLDQLKRKK